MVNDDRFNVPYEFDTHFLGTKELTVDDEIVLATLEGAAEELCILDYRSLQDLSAEVIRKMYAVVKDVCGEVTHQPLAQRYDEVLKGN